MRSVEDYYKAIELIVENPNAKKGYEDLIKFLILRKMNKEAEAVNFLLKEKFDDHSSNIDEKQ